MQKRIPLVREPISEMDAVIQYDKGARLYMLPEYKYFVWKILRSGLSKGRVLDLGTGSGRLAIELARARGCDFDITGLDVSENMLIRARENARKAGVEKRISFVLGNASFLPFADRSFDLVMSYASLHHWFDPVRVFNESYRVAGPQGRVIIRDNQRVNDNPFWAAFIWTLSRFMNKRHRENWPGVIRSSYTIRELQNMMRKTTLKNYRISTDFIKFDVCVETGSKPAQGKGH
ncbi:MAG: class I SAM-dependent methyltransferase [Dehalococcoidales bacterium]|nr:class I SAM-dependent methyltransferase [Dehalococcoidales bacterium]